MSTDRHRHSRALRRLVLLALVPLLAVATASTVHGRVRPARFDHVDLDSRDPQPTASGGTIPTFRVEAPRWARQWAYAGYLGLTALAGTVVLRQLRARRRREADYRLRLESEVQERTQELAARNIALERLNGRLVDASLSDPMTGLRNRRFLFEHVAHDINLLRRRLYERMAHGDARLDEGAIFFLVDIDRFKSINDTFGHPAGDLVILEFVRRMRTVCHPRDEVIRWGGDEFLVIARDATAESAPLVAERLRQAIADAPIHVGRGLEISSSCSIGFASFPFIPSAPHVGSWEETLGFADLALYEAKRNSRNAWAGCSSTAYTPYALDQLLREPTDAMQRAERIRMTRSITLPGTRTEPRAFSR